MTDADKKVTKGPGGPEVKLAKSLQRIKELTAKLIEQAEEEWQDGEKMFFIRTENIVSVFHMLRINFNDYVGMFVNHGILKTKKSDPPGWYIFMPEEPQAIPTKKLQRIAKRLWKNATVSHYVGREKDKKYYLSLDVIKAIIKDLGFSPNLVVPQLIAKNYFVSMNTLPMEDDSYYIFCTQREGKNYQKNKDRK